MEKSGLLMNNLLAIALLVVLVHVTKTAIGVINKNPFLKNAPAAVHTLQQNSASQNFAKYNHSFLDLRRKECSSYSS